MGHDVEHRRRVGADTDGQIGFCEDFRGGHTTDISQTITHCLDGVVEGSDVADTVFQSDQVGAFGRQLAYVLCLQDAIGAVVVDHLQRSAVDHFAGIGHHAIGGAFGQVGRHQQNAVTACFFCGFAEADGIGNAAPGTGDNGYTTGHGIDGNLDDLAVLIQRQGEEFTGTTRDEHRRYAVADKPLDTLTVGVRIELALVVQIGDGERQQAITQRLADTFNG